MQQILAFFASAFNLKMAGRSTNVAVMQNIKPKAFGRVKTNFSPSENLSLTLSPMIQKARAIL